ncbi:MAG: hypothetical protein IT287_02310, partial [Bdellovibrionaceae bacterium]|nr:hypothetical protein [Pseudobdellovibrionaceae bacterium]
WCANTFAAPAGTSVNAFMQKAHKRNSIVSQLLDPKKPQFIKMVSSRLKSPKDKKLYEQIAASKKGANVRFYILHNQFVVNENGKDLSFKLLSTDPLIIQMQNRRVVKVNKNDISGSVLEKNNKKTAQSFLIPKAYAGGGDDDWAFLYAAVQSGEFEDQYGLALTKKIKEEDFPKNVQSFMEHFDVKSINCKNGQGSSGNSASGVTFEDSKGGRYVYQCGDQSLNCKMETADKSGKVVDQSDYYKRLGIHIRSKLQDQARTLGRDPTLDVNDFELKCEVDEGYIYNENKCTLIDRNYTKYTQETRTTLMMENLLTSEINDQYGHQIEEYIKLTKENEKKQRGGYDQGVVIEALTSCCRDRRCSTEVHQKTDVKMESGTVGQ